MVEVVRLLIVLENIFFFLKLVGVPLRLLLREFLEIDLREDEQLEIRDLLRSLLE